MRTKSLLLLFISILILGCSSAPRYYSTTKKGSDDRIKNSRALLTKGVKHTAVMTASYYGEGDIFNGRMTSNGEIFDKNAFTAAHKTLPFNTVLKVTYPATGKSVSVRINDRGPYIKGRDLDLAYAAAKKIGLVQKGVGKVKVTVINWGDE